MLKEGYLCFHARLISGTKSEEKVELKRMDTLDKQILYLSKRRTLYIGKLNGCLDFSKACSQVIISLDKPINMIQKESGVISSALTFLVPAGSSVTINSGDEPVAVITLDCLGGDLSVLLTGLIKAGQKSSGEGCYSDLDYQNELVALLTSIQVGKPSPTIVFKLLEEFIGSRRKGLFVDEPDLRIKKAVDFICSSDSGGVSIDEIAHHVCLSVPRLTQLFKQVTGSSVRRLRNWNRLYIAAKLYSKGVSLNDAAHSAGFADYAHFSRTFKSIIGISPYAVLSEKNNMTIYTLSKRDLDRSTDSESELVRSSKSNALLVES